MKEIVKMKENILTEPAGTMPQVGAMQHMKANPKVSPAQADQKMSPEQTVPNVSPVQTIPNISPVQSVPDGNASPVQTMPELLPVQPNPAAVMPSAMNQMPMMNQMPNIAQMPSMAQMPVMCCPYLMNMQCPMTYGQNVMGMNMMNNMMYPAVSPASGGMGNLPGMGMLPSMDNRYHYQY